MSCLACSLPRLVGLLGLFNSPYPSRTPKLSQWSDRPRRVGLGPQFLSRGSLTVRDSVVIGRRWGFILCGCLSSTWCARWDGICSQIAVEAIAGVAEASCLAWFAPCPAWLACLACSIRPTHPAPPSSVSGLTDRGESGSDHSF